MTDHDLNQVIAQRIIKCPDGQTIEVRMGKPQWRDQGRTESLCAIEVVAPSTTKTLQVSGIDAFQAIELAMKMIGTELVVLNVAEYSGGLRWLEQENNLGFPLPDSLALPELPNSRVPLVNESVQRHNLRNAELRKTLLSKGVDLDAPRKCDLHFWADDQAAGSRLMRFLCAQDFVPEVLNRTEDGDWNVEVATIIPPVIVLTEHFSRYFVEIATLMNCTYDGWGTSV